MAMIPQTLFGQNMSIGGICFQGEVPSFTQPKVTLKTEEFRGGGMDGSIEMDMGLEKMESSFTCTGVRKEALKYFGLANGNAFDATFRGTFKGKGGVETGTVSTVRGMLKEVDMGDWKSGDKAEFKYSVAVTYYKLEVDGVVIYEIDPVNSIRIIDGVDQLTQYRTNLGI